MALVSISTDSRRYHFGERHQTFQQFRRPCNRFAGRVLKYPELFLMPPNHGLAMIFG